MAMKRRRDQKPKKSVFAGVIAAVLLTAALIFFLSQKSLQEPISVSEFKLNTVVKVTLYDSKEEPLLSQIMELCDRYEKIFSRTRKDSEIYRLNEGILPKEDGYYVLSEECAKLIEKGLYYSQLSEGAFDITIEPVSSLWDFTSEERRVPSEADLAEARKLVGYEKVELNGNKIRFAQEGMGIELGAIAKGYIADKMKTFLVEHGVKHGIIDLGGNILCIGEKRNGDAFQIGIQKPFADRNETLATAAIKDKSVVSSGIYERCFEKDGKRYHHILNPATGYPYENDLVAVTIISDLSTEGDGLSTTCFSLGLEKGLEFVNHLENVQAVFITEDGEVHFSDGFEQAVPLTYVK